MHTMATKGLLATKRLLAMSVLATALAAVASPALAQESLVKGVGFGSSDGARTYYPVHCLDGSNGTMYVEHGQTKYCAIAYRGKLRCKKKWTLIEASEYACKVAPK